MKTKKQLPPSLLDSLRKLQKLSLQEDCPTGDVTTLAIVPKHFQSTFKIIAKKKMLACGASLAKFCFLDFDSKFSFDFAVNDGSDLNTGDLFLSGKGPSGKLLTLERFILNLCQRLCGIATLTNQFSKALNGKGITLLDTRKTTPLLRVFERYAVRVGGGTNHRLNLSDRFLIKENHLAVESQIKKSDAITRTVEKCRKMNKKIKIEIEIQSPSQAEEACEAGADIILLDNMTQKQIIQSVALIRKRAKIEVSGGVTLKNIQKFAIPGIDFISVGALTHSVRASDLSLLVTLCP